MLRKPKRKALIIALDGETVDSIKRWDNYKDLPRISRIFRNNLIGKSKSVIPPLSPCAWTSILTGKNPGKHGIYGYDVRKEGEYISNFAVNSGLIRTDGIWDIMEAYGKKSIIMNFHPTYPPFKTINGIMISGLTTPPGVSDFVQPAGLMELLKRTGYRIFPKNLKDKDEYIETIRKRGETARLLMKGHEWDLFAVLFTCLESAYDIFWNDNDAMSEIARATDEEVEKIIETAEKDKTSDTSIFVVSDHGVERQKNTVLINNILMNMGMMTLKKGSKKSRMLSRVGLTRDRAVKLSEKLGIKRILKKRISLRAQGALSYSSKPVMSHVDWSKTKAFSTASGKIFVNLRGREPEGIVEPEEKEEVIRQIEERLLNITDPESGQRIRGEIYLGKDTYSGSEAGNGPDMVFWPSNYAPETWNLKHNQIGPPIGLSKHSLYGIFMAYNENNIKPTTISGINITDILPTVLYSMGIPVPGDIDGKVLDIFRDGIEKEKERSGTEKQIKKQERVFTKEEEEQMKERLRGLGYIG